MERVINTCYPRKPLPRTGVGVLRECHASTQAHHHVHVQHIVVDVEEPRRLRPTIWWPASGAMRHPAYQLLRILPRTRVNRSVANVYTSAGRRSAPGRGANRAFRHERITYSPDTAGTERRSQNAPRQVRYAPIVYRDLRASYKMRIDGRGSSVLRPSAQWMGFLRA